ncbi:ubiquinone biosynthesis accessory factor UbiJ [Stutzerimonas balearica]|jgi:ubiquinone biosynthesis protein UbiJ|uniref:ubiquinone biosynthesis accessory factor UbiJ n=2 Tax=Stutzerimonas balearica TaxID=74829 RepID=UPI000773A419|nr:SCP2 sterol-binding domain-containing protein [Stutzerimonas balearica]MBB61760.1 SCP2 domain-containing protein [Pseudomonas sp.]MBC7197817.1 SCP2 sterol-binding domain-containing protein [Stutzerimonas balearica]MBD3735384.1 SCP2 sterol-binding domain-containing protein [Stutzerimonas balearica]MCF6755881.1 SCP2 sterol-binding domain-containing protein [Stutzerimonas balearica]OMG67279.1 SCP2 domain-containing protein [Stutzerimonas balearica]
MLRQALLASAEQGLNRVLRLDPTALPRLARLAGRIIEIDCSAPAMQLFVLVEEDGLRLASSWAADADCRLRAPASSLVRLLVSRQKTAVLHEPQVSIDGDSGVLMSLAEVLQDLELDWEYEASRWLGPVGAQLLGTGVRTPTRWLRESGDSLRQDLADYLTEESRALVGQQEAEARFSEIDDLKLALDRLEARIERLAHNLAPEKPE